jgi:HAD superfamily hydrolase (TIGR01509 family)
MSSSRDGPRNLIEAVVFDMDGVIIDSEPVWQQVRVDMIGERGGVWTAREGDDTRGRSSEVWSARLSERLGGELTPEEVFTQVLERMAASYRASLPLFPGAVEAIERIATNYTVAVASGSPNVLIDLVLEESGLHRVAAAVGYGDEMPNGKPAPDIYLDVLGRLGVDPSRAVGIEDSESGLQSVQAAGMYSIALVSPGYQLSEDVLVRSAAQIGDLDEVTVSMIDQIAP